MEHDPHIDTVVKSATKLIVWASAQDEGFGPAGGVGAIDAIFDTLSVSEQFTAEQRALISNLHQAWVDARYPGTTKKSHKEQE